MEEQETFIDTATIIREPTPGHISDLCKKIRSAKRVVILQGAGVSVASGIADYRSSGGIFQWLQDNNMDMSPEDALSLEMFMERPEVYHKLEKKFFLTAEEPKPNQGHQLAACIHKLGKLTRVYTQNVDGLQAQVLPDDYLVEFHGNKRSAHCIRKKCGAEYDIERYRTEVMTDQIPRCPAIRKSGKPCNCLVKTDVVLYGQETDEKAFNKGIVDIKSSDLVIVMGTSMEVFPFRSLIHSCTCPVIMMNKVIPKTFPGYLMPNTTFFLCDIEKLCANVNMLLSLPSVN